MEQDESPTGTKTDNFQLNLILGMQNQLNMIMEKLSEGSETESDLHASKKEIDNSKLLNLLKKTQVQVSSLENEIKRVEAENIHQDRDSQNGSILEFLEHDLCYKNSACEFVPQTKNWKSCFWPMQKALLIFQFPAKNMLIMELLKMAHTEFNLIQTYQGNTFYIRCI